MSILRDMERLLRAPFEVPSWYAPNHVLLASFPKSGSTWLRFILANIARESGGHGTEVDFRTLGRYSPEIRRNRDLHDRIEAAGLPLFLKTHFPWTRAFRRYRAIVVVRHPFRVLPSYYDHLKGAAGRSVPALDQFLRHWRYGAHAWCDWHLRWHAHAHAVVKYEDLLVRPRDVIAALFETLELCPDDNVIELAVGRSGRDEMRRLLTERGDPNPRNPGFEFVSDANGRTRRTALNDEQREFVERVTRPALERFGYEIGE